MVRRLHCPKATSCGPSTWRSNERPNRTQNILFGFWLTSPSRRCRQRSMIRRRRSRLSTDQIDDLLRRLGGHDLDAGYAYDADGVLRLIFPMPTWEDYLA